MAGVVGCLSFDFVAVPFQCVEEHRDFACHLLGAAKNAELLVLAGEVGVVLDSHRSTIIAQGPYGVQAILEPAEPGQWARLLIVGARTGNARGESGYAGDQPGETERASGIGVEHEFVTDPCQFPASPGRTCLVVPVPEVQPPSSISAPSTMIPGVRAQWRAHQDGLRNVNQSAPKGALPGPSRASQSEPEALGKATAPWSCGARDRIGRCIGPVYRAPRSEPVTLRLGRTDPQK